ncbi:MAG: hypothetical protein QOC65_257 [Sphingomonadales bacterium]|nr:hypothetical protein [Sphingomonadales bacterium]
MWVRATIVAFLAWFATIDYNPVVVLQARLGLSPSPLERLVGIRGMFSGMTEATHRLVHLEVLAAIRSNILVVPTLAAIVLCIVTWNAPKIDTRLREVCFFIIVIAGTAINNAAPALLAPVQS